MRFELDDLVIDTDRLVAERAGIPIPVQPQVFDLLAYLLLHRDRVVTKEELLDEIWGDRFVSESALTSRIKSARQLVGDDGISQRAIKTFHSRGYRWIAPVGATTTAAPVAAEQLPAFEQPPHRLAPLIGRDHEIDNVSTLMAERTLVTLVGPPGVGKTALASELATRLHSGDTAVAFADVGSCGDRSDAVGVLRRAAGVHRQQPDERSAPEDESTVISMVIGRLRPQRTLLVVDNCDPVAAAVAALTAQLLATCPELTILATARRPLGLAGEYIAAVEPLTVPAPDVSWPALSDCAAGRLFVERSRAGGTRWTECDEEARAITSICRRVDGLPLAIELYAARSRWMSLDDLLRHIDDAFGDIGDPARRSDPLTVAMRSSRSLLPPDAQNSFDALSVFVDTFDIDAALSVIAATEPDADPLDLFELLVECSLVHVVDGRTRRYRLLGPVRAFAESCRIGTPLDTVAVAAHFEHYLRFVRRRWPAGRIATVHPWSLLADERREVEAAARRTVEQRPQDARRLLGALGWFWWIGGDAQRWDELASVVDVAPGLDAPEVGAAYAFARMLGTVLLGGDPSSYSHTAYAAGLETEQWSVAAWAETFDIAPDMMWIDLASVSERWHEIVDLFRRGHDLPGEAWATTIVLGYAQICARQHDDAARSYEAAARMFERCGDHVGAVRALLETVEQHIWTSKDPARARGIYDTIPHTGTELPVETRAKCSWLGGLIAGAEGDHESEVRLHLDALRLCEQNLPAAMLTNTYRCLTACALRRAGRMSEAANMFTLAISSIDATYDDVPHARHRAWVLERAAGMVADLGRADIAAETLGFAERLRDSLSAPMPYWDEPDYERDVELIRGRLAPAEFAERWAGPERTSDEMIGALLDQLCQASSTPG